MDIYEFAMEKEQYAQDLYSQLAGKTQNEGLKNILNMLANEESKHYHIIENMKEQTPEKVTDTDVLKDAKAVFKKMHDGAQKFDFDISEIELYGKARKMEEESISLYQDKADQVDDEDQKRIFQMLADEERKHYNLIDNIREFVNRPNQWLEDAEWYHIEEY